MQVYYWSYLWTVFFHSIKNTLSQFVKKLLWSAIYNIDLQYTSLNRDSIWLVFTKSLWLRFWPIIADKISHDLFRLLLQVSNYLFITSEYKDSEKIKIADLSRQCNQLNKGKYLAHACIIFTGICLELSL